MLIHKKGNLLDMADNGDFDIIVQGCNCFNAMGAGLAPQIAKRYPDAQDADNQTRKGSISKLGNWTIGWNTKDTRAPIQFKIINAYTQYSTSQQGEDVFEYAAFELILRKLAHEYGEQRYGLPYIGMGLAGGLFGGATTGINSLMFNPFMQNSYGSIGPMSPWGTGGR